MGVVKGGLKRMGERVFAPLADGSVIEAEIVSSVFFDPKAIARTSDDRAAASRASRSTGNAVKCGSWLAR
jgi:hypothetical protein